jgi:hypothetical protein
MIRPIAAALLAAMLALPAGAQSLLGQSRPGGTAPAPQVQTAPLPSVQPAPPSGPQLQPGQFLPATPPAPGTIPAPAGPATPSIAPVAPVQAEWLPHATAELRAIDKVMARTTTLTAKPGETLRFGPLAITVRSCVIRPPDRAPDAAGYLEISEGTTQVFRGWMIASQPQLALVEHATHDVRLFACKP